MMQRREKSRSLTGKNLLFYVQDLSAKLHLVQAPSLPPSLITLPLSLLSYTPTLIFYKSFFYISLNIFFPISYEEIMIAHSGTTFITRGAKPPYKADTPSVL